jgi:hypothetical protein
MTAQQAPHATPLSPTPLWRRVFSLPQTPLGWAAVGLASPVWALWVYGIASTLLQGDPLTAGGVILGALFTAPFGLFGAAAGLVAVLQHDRSLLVWLALVPVLLFVSMVFLFVI